MATAVLTVSDVKEGVTTSGKRSVAATVDFDTGDYVTNGLNLNTVSCVRDGVTHTGLLRAIGLKTIDAAFQNASADVDQPYTQAQWTTAVDTKTIQYFVDRGTNGTPEAPLLVMFVGDNQHGASAIDGSAQVRITFVGTAA